MRTSSGGSPISLAIADGVARHALRVAARVRILGVDRRRERTDRGEEELLVLPRRLLHLLEGVPDRRAHAVEVLREVRDLRGAGDLDGRPVLPLGRPRASTPPAGRSVGTAAARREVRGAARPPRQTALQTTVSRTIRSTEAKAMSRSRSTSTPQGGSPTGAIDASTAPDGRRLATASAGPESGRSPRPASTDARAPRPAGPGERGSCPGGPRASPAPPAAPRPGIPARWAARTRGPRRPRCASPFSSGDRLRQDRHRSELRPRTDFPRSGRRRAPSRSPCGTRSPSPVNGRRARRSCPGPRG